MTVLFLIVSSIALLAAQSAVRRPGAHGPFWLVALAVGELAPFHLVGLAAVTGLFVLVGAHEGAPGAIALGIALAAWVMLAWAHLRALRTKTVVADAVGAFVGEPVRLPALRFLDLFRPIPPTPARLERTVDLAYGPDPAHRVDRIRGRDQRGPAPVLVQVHGGGWTRGRRYRGSRPLMHRMAAAGWVVFDTDYRKSPRATFPDPVVDIKRLVAWIRETADEHGIDPEFIAVTGGSAAGQIVAVVALTNDDERYQPGFEDADATVQACLPFYGVHDLLTSEGRPLWPYLVADVMKSTPDQDPMSWRAASPARSATADRPPFFVVHGTHDSLVGVSLSRRLITALRDAGGPRVGRLEVPGATHGFDVFNSVRSLRVVDGVQVVLEHLRERRAAVVERERKREGR